MQLGLSVGNTTVGTAEFLGGTAATAEDLGFDSIWVADHVVWPVEYDSPYPYGATEGEKYPGDEHDPAYEAVTTLAWLSARTSRIKVGTLVLVAPQREPWLLAKQLATVDALNGGRTIIGMGLGWLREEFDVLGAPFDDRVPRTRELVELLRAVWTQHPLEFQGSYWSSPPMGVLPHPAQGTIPIWFGGNSPGARRRVAAYGDGWAPYGLSPEDLAAGWADIRQQATDNGRDPDDITCMLWAPVLLGEGTAIPGLPLTGSADQIVEAVGAYAEAGLDHLVMVNIVPPEAMRDQLEGLAGDVLPAVHEMCVRDRPATGTTAGDDSDPG